MNTALWTAQALLALIFLMTGAMKLIVPKEKAVERTPFVQDLTQGQLHTIGILEILGATGLILPGLTGILPWLTPLAAAGLALTMIGAMIVHYRRKEYGNIIGNVVLFALSVFVAYGRFVVVPL